MSQQEKFLRFPLGRRIEHWLNVLSFTILAVTGLIQKFNTSPISEMMFSAFGGVETVRILHRIAAIILMLVTIYHFGGVLYGWYVKRVPLSMLPGKDDVIAAWKQLRYNLGFEKKSPKQGFYTFEEKFEYWALVWGTLIMGITGFFLWNPITTAKILPGAWIPVAKAAHGNEAVLAVLAIILWHTYHVIIKHFNKSMYSGYMSREEMEHYHPLALEGEQYKEPLPGDSEFKRRKRLFAIVYTFAAAVMLAGVYGFISVEETAVMEPAEIEDIANISSYSPLDPTPYPSPTVPENIDEIGDSWENGFEDLFARRCIGCHSSSNTSAGLDLTTYQGLLDGGESGPALRPNAPGVSLVVIWPFREDHPGPKFSEVELAAIREWIQNGAP